MPDAPARSRLQNSIFRSLDRTEPALADLYEGARQLVAADIRAPGFAWFVAHAIRVLVDEIPALEGISRPGGDPGYGRRIEEIADTWEPLGLLETTADDGMVKDVPCTAIGVVADLVREAGLHRTRRERLGQTFAQRAPSVGHVRHDVWARELNELHQENARRAHTGKAWPAPIDCQESFRKLEIVLAGIFGEYAPNRRELDDILAAANRRRD